MTISRKLRNLLRRERRANPTVQVLLNRLKGETPEKRVLREQATILYSELRHKGVTWAACIQAIKTNWVAQLKNKHRI
jgi:hypothetical protein